MPPNTTRRRWFNPGIVYVAHVSAFDTCRLNSPPQNVKRVCVYVCLQATLTRERVISSGPGITYLCMNSPAAINYAIKSPRQRDKKSLT